MLRVNGLIVLLLELLLFVFTLFPTLLDNIMLEVHTKAGHALRMELHHLNTILQKVALTAALRASTPLQSGMVLQHLGRDVLCTITRPPYTVSLPVLMPAFAI